MSQAELHSIFQIYGPIISAKISKNSDHSSKGFAYLNFKDEEAAQNAIAKGAHIGTDKLFALPYNRPTTSANDAPNNLYVKHIPEDWNEKRITKEFSKFGHLKSVKLCRNKYGPYAFVCFEDPNDALAGAKAA